MPTYDYECTKCGHSFDAFQSMSDSPLLKCPSCGKNSLRRLIGGGLGVIFKGSGFYVTDVRGANGGKKAAPKETATPESGDKAPAAASSESAKTNTSEPKGDGAKSKSDKAASKSKA